MEKATLKESLIEERIIKIDEIFADPIIKKFNYKSRKCLFSDESSSKYFNVSKNVTGLLAFCFNFIITQFDFIIDYCSTSHS
jgi:hypothetical protein